MGVCALVYVFCLAADPSGVSLTGFTLLSPSTGSLFLFGASGAVPIFGFGRWWTPLSAGWLHGGLLHIAFNLMTLRNLAPAVAEIYGPGRLMILYNVASIGGFVLTSLVAAFMPFLPSFMRGADLTVGASAGIFGLLGALVLFGHRGGPRLVGSQTWSWVAMMVVFGLVTGGRIDNYAHLGGFLAGYVGAKVLDPLRPERGDHVLIGLGLVVASLIAIAVSFFHGRQFI
jgi:rhomboid protease GluP